MEKLGVHCIAFLLIAANVAHGRPTMSEPAVFVEETIQRPVLTLEEKEEVRISRMEVELMREERPCFARLLEVRTDIKELGDIAGDPHYVPECTKDGKKWRSAQCDHHDAGACFCVYEDSGEIVNNTRDLRLNKEALKCGERVVFSDHSDHLCFHMKGEFEHMQVEFGLESHSPLPYYPDCTDQGKFKAIQRNDRSQFFCVDSHTGEIIPDTIKEASHMPPLREDICQAYDDVWQDFKKWNSTQEKELRPTEDSCGVGFTFTECGCPRKCTSNTNAAKEECVCRPACICPEGKYDLDGRCVSLEECHEAIPQSSVFQSNKLDYLTGGAFTRWQQYLQMNPNIVLERYNSMGQIEDVYAGGPIAYDPNPARSFFMEGAPPPEELHEYPPEELPTETPVEFGTVGAEEIEGDEKADLLKVLENKTVTQEEEESQRNQQLQEIEDGEEEQEERESIENMWEDSEDGTYRILRLGESLYRTTHQQEEEGEGEIYPNIPSEEYYERVENNEYNGFQENLNESAYNYVYEHYQNYEYELANETQKEWNEEEAGREETTGPYEYMPEEVTEPSTTQKDEETLEETSAPVVPHSEELEPEIFPEEATTSEETDNREVPENENRFEADNFPGEEPTIPEETDNLENSENDNGFEPPISPGDAPFYPNVEEGFYPENEEGSDYNEEPNEHQKMTSVPAPPNDEIPDNTMAPPCEESESEEADTTPLDLITRVLVENKVIEPQAEGEKVVGILEKHSPTIKKSIMG